MNKKNKSYLLKYFRYINNILYPDSKKKINKLKKQLEKKEIQLKITTKNLMQTKEVLKSSQEILSALMYHWDNDISYECNCKKYNLFRTN